MATPTKLQKEVFHISTFLKVIHAPKAQKDGVYQVLQKWTSYIAVFISLQSGLLIDLLNIPVLSFLTGAMRAPTKLKNTTVSGWGGLFHSYFLKVIHAPKNLHKEGMNQVPQKWTLSIGFF